MNATLRKTILIAVVAVLGLGLLGGGAVWLEYRRVVAASPAVTAAGPLVVTPGVKSALGTSLTATMPYRCPWGRAPQEAVFTPGDGVKTVGRPEIRRQSHGWGSNVWEIAVTLKPFRTGRLTGSTLETEFTRTANAAAETKKISLPPLEITPLTIDDPSKLALASAIDRPALARRTAWWIAGIAGGLVLLAGIWWWFRRRREQALKPLTPWQEALLELVGLRQALTARVIPAETCFGRLTDIVRNYLEKRFRLRAPQQTTEEFLGDLKRGDSPLTDEHRHFLHNFLTAADLVKFAGIPADGHLLDQAIGSAETLIDQTKPQEDKP